MEDFGTIIWVLVVIGIAAANGMSKYRKARGKGAPHTGEAWPSSDEGPGIPTQPEIPDIFGLPRTASQKAAPQPVPKPRTAVPQPPVAAAGNTPGPGQAHPSREYGTAGGSRRILTPTTADTAHAQLHEIKAQNAPKGAKYAQGTSPRTAATPQAEGSVLGEEFDLRRAIIYSEIMKPKFEEP